jgi:hypothetical protein
LNNNITKRKKINSEKNIVKMMILYYCKKKHFSKNDLCCDCEKLIEYSWLKLDKCPYGENKPACSKCEIHCYSAPMRKKIKDIMRYSGPRTIYIYPAVSIKHFISKMNFKKDSLSKI